MRRRPVLIALATGLLSSCGDSSPTAPTADRIATIELRVERNTILAFDTVRVTALARRADGSEVDVDPIWAVDNPQVAIVQQNGDVTGLGHGRALIVATHGEASASVPLNVIANYQGTWTGSMAAVDCDYWDPRVCGRSFLGQTEIATLSVVQSGTTVRAVLRRASASRAELTGHVTDTGALLLSGHFITVRASGEEVRGAEVIGWRTRLDAAGIQTGEFTSALQAEFFPLVVVYELRGLVRGST
jgi:hypothetical protein